MGSRGLSRRSQRRNRGSFRDPLEDLDPDPVALEPGRSQTPVRLALPKTARIEDRRQWAPTGPAVKPRIPVRDVTGRPARIVHKVTASRIKRGRDGNPMKAPFSVIGTLRNASPVFDDVGKTIICAKRKIRREVMFALNLRKSGAGSPKRRNAWSDVQCGKRS